MKQVIILFIISIFASCGGSSDDGHIQMKSNIPEAFETRSEQIPAKTENNLVSNLTANQFKSKIFDYSNAQQWSYKHSKGCVIDFYADWCRPCKILEPTLKGAIAKYDGAVDLFKVNIDKEQELAAAFNVQSIPTLLFCPADGSKPFILQGLLPEAELLTAIDKIK